MIRAALCHPISGLLATLALAAALLPTPSLHWQLALCVPVIAIFGLPHGATDWHLAALIWRPRYGRAWPAFFAALYGALMLLVAAAAAVSPRVTLAAFLGLAAFHFGTEDAEAWEKEPSFSEEKEAKRLLAIGPAIHSQGPIRVHGHQFAKVFCCFFSKKGNLSFLFGIPPITAPCLFWPHQYATIIATLGVHAPASLIFNLAAAIMALWAISALLTLRGRWAAAAELAALFALQAAAPPLMAFTVYFCMVHAPRHMASLPRGAGFWQSLPVSAAAIAIIAGAVWLAAGTAGFAWAATNGLIWGLAALALPHAVLAGIFRKEKKPKRFLSNGRAIRFQILERGHGRQCAKVFCCFFSKKQNLPFLSNPPKLRPAQGPTP